ncbi:MAG: hypothetical protein FWB80_10685 [Defluviitaleaceae bacterium]|nr:hypothetical protein [Defluviitaleaceae bacterium]
MEINTIILILASTASIAALAWLLFSLRKLLKNLNIKKFFLEIFEFIGKKLTHLTSKLPTGKAHRPRLFSDEKIRIFSEKKRNPFRKMKWKNLQTHRERVRFIYVSYLQSKIKKGAIVTPSNTPNELSQKLNPGNKSPDAQLFPLYNKARYANETTPITEEEITEILPLK